MPKKKTRGKMKKRLQAKKRIPARRKKTAVRKTAKRLIKKIVVRKRTAVKRPPAPKKAGRLKTAPIVEGIVIGKISHYYPQVNAAVLKVQSTLRIGDTIRIKGHTTDFTETAGSIQINRVPITEAKKGDEIGLLVTSRVRSGDIVYKI